MGFVSSDGSDLVGGLNPSGVGKAFQVDTSGRILTQDFLRQANVLGQAFTASNGLASVAAATVNAPFSIFNPNTGKNILIYSIIGSNGNSSIAGFLTATTVDPAYGTTITPVNTKAGGAASIASVTWTATSQTAPANSAIFASAVGGQSAPLELLTNGAVYLLPANANNGLTAWVQSFAGGYNPFTVKWIEF